MHPFFLDYVWIDGVGELHSKIKVLYDFHNPLMDPNNVPHWNYDGSSTGQAEGNNSEITLIPRALFKNPHRENSLIVLCDTWARETPIKETNEPKGTNHKDPLVPALYNNRNYATTVFENETVVNHKPWYGLEQEYFLRPCGLTDEKFKSLLETYHLTMPGRAYCGIGRGAIHNTKNNCGRTHGCLYKSRYHNIRDQCRGRPFSVGISSGSLCRYCCRGPVMGRKISSA